MTTQIKTNQSLDIRDVLKSFPFPEFRRFQKETIEEIAQAFNSGYRWILLETPTGFGKSPVNVAFCRALHSFYITPQNILIDQLNRDFPDLALIKGREHYNCAEILRGNCAENAPCKQNSEYICHNKYVRCPYWITKIRAIEAQTALTNFAYFVGEGLLHDTNVPHFGDRELLVIDEGHNIDQHILDHISITVESRTLPHSVFQSIKKKLATMPERLTSEQIDELLNDTALHCKRFLDSLPDILSKEQVREKEKALKFRQKVENYWKNHDAEWVGQTNEKIYKKGVWIEAKIQPIYARGFTYNHLWKRANRFIISSATIFMHDLVKECGLSEHADEVCYTHTLSTFPIRNRMIINAAVGSLSWNKKEENLPTALGAISKILDVEKGKGIIHAHSYGFAEAIKNGIPNPRLMFHISKDRDDVLNDFLEALPESGKVLVSVAMTEGLDLKGDLATFQILFKCPFPNYREDLRVYRRLKELKHNKWYGIQTLKTIIQAYGRAVRSPTDVAKFYVIDDDVNRVCKRWYSQLPQFFREAYNAREQFL
jgi:Rad3-related DNA helicase